MIVRITGGIGNQMFQYALKKSMDYKGEKSYLDLRFYDRKQVHNGYELERVFGMKDELYSGKLKAPSEKYNLLCKVFYKLGKRMLKTPHSLTEILIDYYSDWKKLSGKNFFLDGYWQSEDYFADCQKEIRECFVFPAFTEQRNIDLIKMISGKETVAIHVRRGDFLGTSKFECLGTTDYYQKSVVYILNKVKNPLFIVLSDDISWCKSNLELDETTLYVDWNSGNKSFRDMQIMSVCKHNIIANSSFSWWGAWLNGNPKKIVVAPDHFYKGHERDESHLIPKDWVKISYQNI